MIDPRIEELELQYKKDLAKLKHQIRVEDMFDNGKVHIHSLYGAFASVDFGEKWSWGDKLKPEEMHDVGFEVVDCYLVKDGCLSWQTAPFYEEQGGKPPQRADLTSPYQIRVSCDSVQFKYHVKTNFGIVMVSHNFAPGCFGLSVSARRVEYRGGFRYDDVQVRGLPLGGTMICDRYEMMEKRTWARGSSETINEFSVYFTDTVGGEHVGPVEFLNGFVEKL